MYIKEVVINGFMRISGLRLYEEAFSKLKRWCKIYNMAYKEEQIKHSLKWRIQIIFHYPVLNFLYLRT